MSIYRKRIQEIYNPEIYNVTEVKIDFSPSNLLHIIKVERLDLTELTHDPETASLFEDASNVAFRADQRALCTVQDGNAYFVFSCESMSTPENAIELLARLLKMVTSVQGVTMREHQDHIQIQIDSGDSTQSRVELARSFFHMKLAMDYFFIKADMSLERIKRALPYIRRSTVSISIQCALDTNKNFIRARSK